MSDPALAKHPAVPSFDDWQAKVAKDLRGGDVARTLRYRDPDGLGLRVLEDESTAPTGGDPAGFPGVAPFTRGASLPSTAPWIVGQEVVDGDVSSARSSVHHDLGLGGGALWLRFATPTRPGLRLTGSRDLTSLLDGVDASILDLSFDVGPNPLLASGLVLAWSRDSGQAPSGLRGTLALDLPGALAAGGRLDAGLDALFTDLAAAVRWSLAEAPQLRACLVSSRPFHDAGATPVQELALALSSGLETLRRLEAHGIPPEDAASQVLAVHCVGRDLFLEIAKLRAWRLLWSKLLAAAGAGASAGSQRLAILPSRPALTRIDPWMNLLRAGAQTFAGACGGADVIFTAPHDTLFKAGETHSRRTAINLQHVLAQEAHLSRVADPAGGSWALERMTDRLARGAWDLFRDVEREGGFVRKLLDGGIQRRLAEAAAQRRGRLASRREGIVGLSVFPNLGEQLETAVPERTVLEPEPPPADPVERTPREVVSQLAQGTGLASLHAALATEDCAICEPLGSFRAAEDFEEMRLEAGEGGACKPVLLAGLGSAAEARARLEFCAGFFSVGGLATVPVTDVAADGWDSAAEEELGRAFHESGAAVAVLCSSDERYGELVGPAALTLRRAGAERILLAGRPGDAEASWRQSGVDDFVYIGRNLLEALAPLLEVSAGALGDRA